MTEDVYRRLAHTLHSIPNGFPPTESGVELRLLAKIFAPEEAALASVMRLTWEPADEIAARAGVDAKAAHRRLKTMARKGQIYAGRKDRQLKFRLMPFAVGIYEEQLPRIDEEFAMLFEQYYQEAQGAFNRYEPALHRVIPVEEAVPAGIEIYPYERATELVEKATRRFVNGIKTSPQVQAQNQRCIDALARSLRGGVDELARRRCEMIQDEPPEI